MSEIKVTQLFAEAVNPYFVAYPFEIINRNDFSQRITGYTYREKSAENDKFCIFRKKDEIIIQFSDMLLHFSGDPKAIWSKYVNNHHILVTFSATKVYFYDIYKDFSEKCRKFSLLGEFDKLELLYMFNSIVNDLIHFSMLDKEDFNLGTFKSITEGYGMYAFKNNLQVLDNTKLVPEATHVIANITKLFLNYNGYPSQRIFTISIQNGCPAVMNSVILPKEAYESCNEWLLGKTKIVSKNTLEIFDISNFSRQNIDLSKDLDNYKYCSIANINGNRILRMILQNHRAIYWNLDRNETFLYKAADENKKIDKEYYEYRIIFNTFYLPHEFPHIFIQDNSPEIKEEEKKYDIYCNIHSNNPICITAIGKPQTLICTNGNVVFFIKTFDEDSKKIIGMMFVLDKEQNLINYKKNVNLISIYNDNEHHNSKMTFVFVES